jgi:hypothetical protein
MVIISPCFHEFSLEQTYNPSEGKVTIVRVLQRQVLGKAWISQFDQIEQQLKLITDGLLRHFKIIFLLHHQKESNVSDLPKKWVNAMTETTYKELHDLHETPKSSLDVSIPDIE